MLGSSQCRALWSAKNEARPQSKALWSAESEAKNHGVKIYSSTMDKLVRRSIEGSTAEAFDEEGV